MPNNNSHLFLLKLEHDFEVFSLELVRVNEALAKLDKMDKFHSICNNYAEYIDHLLHKASYTTGLNLINSYYHELTGDYLSYDPERRVVVVTKSIRR